METWQHFLGVRAREVNTVWLFFLHNFLLGIGSILIYVAANVILLDHEPQRNLPLAYGLSALAMLGVGRLYTHVEHRLPLKTLASRTLLVVVGATAALGVLVVAGPTVGAAVALMVIYRVIYLLTNLEFWGVSAVVFDVRQGRRLFSVISSGDLPAKALGAVLAIFVHAQADVLALLLVAFAAYLGALYTQHLTFASHVVEARPAPHPPQSATWQSRLLGSNSFTRSMGLSLLAIGAVATGVEFLFFVQVKQKVLDEGTVLRYVGSVLALTYLVAMLGKLLLTRHGLDRLGVARTLQVLPVVGLLGLGLFAGLGLAHVGSGAYLVYFCGLYLGIEVLRRAVFEPVCLVLFQPLAPWQRLEGHTLVKGFYEPLGMGLTGLLLYLLPTLPAAGNWLPFVWMSGLLALAIWLLQRTYQHYVRELKQVVARRFVPGPAGQQYASITPAAWCTTDLLRIREKLDRAEQRLAASAPALGPTTAATDLAPAALHHANLQVRKEAILNHLTVDPTYAPARASLHKLATAEQAEKRMVALELVQLLEPEQQVALLRTCLRSAEPALMKAASQAAGQVPTPEVVELLLSMLPEKGLRKLAVNALVQLRNEALPALHQALLRETDYSLLRRLAGTCARLATPESRQVLIALAQQTHLTRRAAALHALGEFDALQHDAPLFQALMQKELQLAQQLLHGMLGANVELRTCLKYELTKVQQRLFALLLQLYDRQPILDAQRGLARARQERQANALEILENLIPRPLYQGLQALVDVGRLTKKVQAFDELLGPLPPVSIGSLILEQGEEAFSPWTISVALRQWQPTPATVPLLHTYLHATNDLIRESAQDVVALLPARHPAVYEHWVGLYPAAEAPAAPAPGVPTVERVLLLKHTALFAATPENVLSSIVPIMKEVTFAEGEQIFAKGELGASLFIIYEGEVGIFNGEHQLAAFREGDFFGELALLDAEPRSATALSKGRVVAFRLDQEDFYDVMEECAEVLQNVLRVLCQRLRLQNEKTRQLAQPHPA